MNPLDIISKFYDPDSRIYEILVQHGKLVAKKALDVAGRVAHLDPDLDFIEEAAMLHDVGIFLTNTPDICCIGEYPYICHGVLGRKLLEKNGLPKHALVCERHIGTGITAEDVENYDLPLPKRDMLPVSIEEQIICYADKFFSKENVNSVAKQKSVEDIKQRLEPYGHDKVMKFQSWVDRFERNQ